MSDMLTDEERQEYTRRMLEATSAPMTMARLGLHIENLPQIPPSPEPIDHTQALKGIQDAVSGVHGDKIVAQLKKLEGAPNAVKGLTPALIGIAAAIEKIEVGDFKALISCLDGIAKNLASNTAAIREQTKAYLAPKYVTWGDTDAPAVLNFGHPEEMDYN